MDRLQAMKVFIRVAESGSFSRAADMLSIPRASATIVIQQLEAHLKVRLLQRTTRRLSLTTSGAAYYERCVRILADIDDAESAIDMTSQSPRGKLRIDMPTLLGRLIVMPALFEFMAQYPDIELMVGFGDRPVDLIQEGVDCAIRIGVLQDSTLVARRLGDYQAVTVASPAYLARNGVPLTLADLDKHVAVNYFWGRHGRLMEMTFVVDGHSTSMKIPGALAVNDTDAYMAGCLRGAGIIQAPLCTAAEYLQSGELVELLKQWKPMSMPISVVYPQHRHLSPTLRVFVDWVAELFENHPLLQQSAQKRAAANKKPHVRSIAVAETAGS
ncbi:LysR family transcriptional regulator [Duganella aceris]|uniref:LysR family transcriptional regulator n=1 Tax=Duganella aceris TaxID=2703883 RepID=A0ABX0FKH3_9BURK|nr:LysR family transcriptional regulator [Duganella aceris]NGZ85091.1 LysR family transcriptional regulator [Duganella aceris]